MEDELLLEEQDRAKLDGIVEQMVANGEKDEDIQFVVSDFKQKYGQESAPVKKKETTESPSPVDGTTSVSGGSLPEPSVPKPKPIEIVPDQTPDPEIVTLYEEYKKAGQLTDPQVKEIKDTLEAQKEGDRGFWETAIAVTEGYIKTGHAVPMFKYDNEEDLIAAREQTNKVDFLGALSEEQVENLRQYQGQKIAELDSKNLNVLAQNKMFEEKGKSLVNDLKKMNKMISQLEEEGIQGTPEDVAAYRQLESEMKSLATAYNKNIDIIENNTEDIGDFYEEVNLLKKNYGGLDYYMDLARLTTADIGAGAVKFIKEAGDAAALGGPTSPGAILSKIDEEAIKDFTDEVAAQKDYLRPSISVADINSMEDFGMWFGEQLATQLPVYSTLFLTGGTSGLGILGAGAAGQKITELEGERQAARENLVDMQNMIDSGQLSMEEIEDLEKEMAKAEKLSEGSDAEFLLAGTGVGLLEAGSERVTLGILSKGKRAFTAALKSGNKAKIVDGMKQGVFSGVEEGSSELGNALGANLIDIMYLKDSDTHILDGTLDALASGTFLGFGMRTAPPVVGAAINTITTKPKYLDIRKKTKQVAELLGEIEVNAETLDDGTKNLIRRKSRQLSKEIKAEIKDAFGVISRMEPDNIQRLIDIDKEANKLAVQAKEVKKSNIGAENKQSILEDLKARTLKLSEEKQTIIENAPKRKKKEQPTVTEKRITDEGKEVGAEAVEGEGVPQDVKGTPIDLVGRKIRIINPFTTAAPIAEITLSESLDNKIDGFNERIINRFARLFRIQEGLESKKGKALPKSQDFRQAEIGMHGKAAYKMQNFYNETETLIQDVVKSEIRTVKDPETGKERNAIERFSDYLYARHAKERNEHIRKLPIREVDGVPQRPPNDAGSGMSDAKADQIMESFNEAEMAAMQRLAKRVDDTLQETRDILLEGGLITELQHETLGKYYENYVPLQGFESESLESDIMSAFGLSMSVKGKETRRAAGRTTKADNVLINVVAMRNSAIIRAEKNQVMQKLYNMAKAHPDTDTWMLFSGKRPDVVWKIDEVSGKTGYYPANMQNTKKYVGVKIRGNQYYIKFANERLADILNAASVEKSDMITRTLGKFNRYMSSVLTTYNPEFVVSNFLRDIQTALINQMSESETATNTLKGKQFAMKTVASTVPSIQAIYRAEKGMPGRGEADRYYEEFKQDGAKTDWFYAKDAEGLKKDMERIVTFQTKGGGVNAAKKAWKSSKNFLDNINTAVENGVRLASYMEARKAGSSRQDAASFAKELTVNFNQKGTWGTTLNSWFLFFNAGTQGIVRFLRAMTRFKRVVTDEGDVKYGLNRGQKVAGAITGLSSLITLMNLGMSGDDEDGVSFYDKIPDWEKERNLIVMKPDGKNYFKIPLPYGYNIFHNMGTVISEVGAGSRTKGDGVGFLFNSFMGAFSPISFPDSEKLSTKALKVVAPTVAKPFIEIAANESYFGSTIYNKNFPVGVQKPESQLGRPSTSWLIKETAELLNQATGGTSFEPGAVDVNPDVIEHFAEFIGGGTAKFVNRVAKTGTYAVKLFNGQEVEIEPRDIPFLNKVYGESTAQYVNQEVYYDRRIRIDQLRSEYEADVEKNKGKERFKGVIKLDNRQKWTDKRLKKIRQLMNEYNKIEDPVLRSKKMKEAREKEQALISGFNKRYNELRDD